MNLAGSAQLGLIPAVVAFVLSAALFPLYIRWLKSRQIQQYIREEGPQSHAAKAKTPTMGGLCFLSINTVVSFAWIFLSRKHVAEEPTHSWLAPLMVIILGGLCGLLGFADDYGKITSQSNKGLSAKARLAAEFIGGCVFGFALYFTGLLSTTTNFLSAMTGSLQPLAMGAFLLILIPFLVTATTNALNLHDGMDGLAAGTSIQVFLVLAIMLFAKGEPWLGGVAASMVGALAGFLIYNRYKAKVFMGDTGSLYIGGLMAGLIVAGGLVLWFIPLSLIYIAEALSVMLQVSYFKLTKPYTPEKPMSMPALVIFKLTKRLPGEGKRFFRMAPLHHHFEAIGEDHGIAEWKVVACFWVAQFALCAAVLFAYFSFASK